MKTTTKEEVTSSKINITIYSCDASGCTFETQNRDDAKRHEYFKHQAKGTQHIHGTSFYLLENENDMHNLIENGLWHEYDHCYGTFKEVGWYGVCAESYEGGYGQSIDAELFPMSHFISIWGKEIEDLKSAMDMANDLLKTNKEI